jgi:hypothetical protein
MLLGGDKAGKWTRWYKRAIPKADDLYDSWLVRLRLEALK